MRVAVIGTGISGNVAAYHLCRNHEVAVYEAAAHVGGHTDTHEVAHDGRTLHIDTGFIVFNDRNYPSFVQLLDELGVASQPSSMSFSVRDELSGLEYNGTSLDGLFAQRRNLLRPAFWRMLGEILRFNREASALLDRAGCELTLGEFLLEKRYCRELIDYYVIPMGAAIWSTDPASMRRFPARFFVRFLHNHGMLTLAGRPQWRVIRGGSARYVEKLTAGYRGRIRLNCRVELIQRRRGEVLVKAQGCPAERFDTVFLACHSDQALAMLADADSREREVLGAIPYQRNEAVLHTDERLLPRARRAWAAWNYHALGDQRERVALTYNMNILQSLNTRTPYLVTLNRSESIDPAKIIKRMQYDHPLYTPGATAAQARQREINGGRGVYFCGAYWGNGFHEDGVVSARAALRHFEEDLEHARLQLPRRA